MAPRSEIALRILELLGGREIDLTAAAVRLRVDEVALRISVDKLSPYPTVDVIAAMVREYGVDPSWLLTGTYDPATHRSVMDANTAELPTAINNFIDNTRRIENLGTYRPRE